MFRAWSIADGPADLTDNDVGQTRTFTLKQADGSLVNVPIKIASFGDMHGGDVHSFRGQLFINSTFIEVIGHYHVRDRTGDCHSIHAAA